MPAARGGRAAKAEGGEGGSAAAQQNQERPREDNDEELAQALQWMFEYASRKGAEIVAQSARPPLRARTCTNGRCFY